MSRATAAGCGAIGLWAFLAPLARGAADVPPFALVALCFSVSAAGGLLWLGLTGRLHDLRQRPVAWVHGVGGLFGFHALYFAALSAAPPATANLLNYSWPLMLVVLSAMLAGSRLTWPHWAGVALGASGCVLLLAKGARFESGAATGYVLALASASVWAVYSVTAQRFRAVPTGAVVGFCAATATLATFCHVAFESAFTLDSYGAAVILALGLGPLGGAFFLWDIGMKRGDPRLLGTLSYAAPVLSTLLLIAGGYADLTVVTVLAAILVTAGGLVATT